MIKEKREFIYKPFSSQWVSLLWEEVNKWYDDGWRVCENTGNKIKDVPVLMPGMVRMMFERDSVSLALEKLKSLTKVDEYKEFCNECDIEYDVSLTKKPMKMKKFIRTELENMLNPKVESKVKPEVGVEKDIYLNKDSFKTVNE